MTPSLTKVTPLILQKKDSNKLWKECMKDRHAVKIAFAWTLGQYSNNRLWILFDKKKKKKMHKGSLFGHIIDVKQTCTTGSAVKYGPNKIYWNIDKTGWVNDECRGKNSWWVLNRGNRSYASQLNDKKQIKKDHSASLTTSGEIRNNYTL